MYSPFKITLLRLLIYLTVMIVSYVFLNRDSDSQDFTTENTLPKLEIREIKDVSSNLHMEQMRRYVFSNHRLTLWFEGRCIDSIDGETLSIQFCDPKIEQVRDKIFSTSNYDDKGGSLSMFNSSLHAYMIS